MTASMLAVALCTGLVALAVFGPALLRHAAPALVRVPRLAIVVVAGGVGVWLVTLLAIGPVLAWAGSGPALLPERAAEVCQRCLSAANPFSADTTDTLVPAVLLLALPVALALALGAGLARQTVRRSSPAPGTPPARCSTARGGSSFLGMRFRWSTPSTRSRSPSPPVTAGSCSPRARCVPWRRTSWPLC